MIRTFLLLAAALCGLIAAGLVFGWGFGIFDEPSWQKDAGGWAGLSLAAGFLSFHPWIAALDESLDGRRSRL